MSSSTLPALMTAEEFLELPENGRDRFLIRGQLWDRPMTYRNPFHSAVMVQFAYLLVDSLRLQPALSLKVVCDEAGFRLRPEPGSIVGIDVAVVSKSLPHYTYKNRVVFDGSPVLAVEILSPSDRQREIEAKVDEYLAVGVPLVWVVSPHFRTVTAHRPTTAPEMFASDDELPAEEIIPGLRIAVQRIFETM